MSWGAGRGPEKSHHGVARRNTEGMAGGWDAALRSKRGASPLAGRVGDAESVIRAGRRDGLAGEAGRDW